MDELEFVLKVPRNVLLDDYMPGNEALLDEFKKAVKQLEAGDIPNAHLMGEGGNYEVPAGFTAAIEEWRKDNGYE